MDGSLAAVRALDLMQGVASLAVRLRVELLLWVNWRLGRRS